MHPRRAVELRQGRLDLPLSATAALSAGGATVSYAELAQAIPDKLSQVAGRPAPAARAPAVELVVLLEQAGEG